MVMVVLASGAALDGPFLHGSMIAFDDVGLGWFVGGSHTDGWRQAHPMAY
jgi:hypothetical protein